MPQTPTLPTLLRDLFRRGDMRGVLKVWQPLAAGFAVVAIAGFGLGPTPAALWFLFGLGGWTLLEYILHRWVFHWEPRGRLLTALARPFGPPHIRHHRRPDNIDQTVLTPQGPALWVAAVLFLSLVAIGYPVGAACMMLSGGCMGFLAYQTAHFACHHWPMTSRYGAMLKRHHLVHHHLDDRMNYGLTSPVWDIVFGTLHRSARAEQAGG